MTITNGYATLDQARSRIAAYSPSDTSNDAIIELCIEAASRQIDTTLGFRLWQDSTEVVREFYAYDHSCVDLYEQPWNDPKAGISTTTNLVVKIDSDADGTWADTLTINTDFILLPPNSGDDTETCWNEIRAVDNYSFPLPANGRPGVQVTAKFGWSAVPDWATQACLIQTEQLFKAKDAPFGVASFGDMGTSMRVKEALNPLAAALVRPHARASVG